jgi:hypothetical protein
MSKQKTKVQAKPKLTPHLKRVIAEGEKAWREGNVKVVSMKQLMKITRSLHD